MLKKTLIIMLNLMLIAGLFLAGCSNNATPTGTAPATTAATSTVTPASGPVRGGTLRLIAGAEINSFMVGEMYSPEDMAQRSPGMETLVRFDITTQEVVPFLAQALTEDSAAKTIIFKLRDGVLFHDGTVCDAEAVKWNLDQEAIAPNTAPDFAGVSSIEAIDKLTVKVSFKEWDNSFLREMCWDSCVISPTAFKEKGLDYVRTNLVGTGPFKLVTFERDVKKVFQKWEHYWMPDQPYLDEVIFNIIAEPTVQMASFLKGENDVLTGINPTDAKNLKSNDNFVVVPGFPITGTINTIVGDSVNPDSPFSKLEVRQAVAYAINRQAIVDYVFNGYAAMTNGLNDPACWTYNPNVAGYPYNPAKAKELLAAAGYPDGFSTTIYLRSEKVTRDMCTAIQGDLAQVNIKADVQAMESGQYGVMMFGTGWSNGLLQCGNAGDPELGVVGRFFISKAAGIGITASIIHPDDVENAITNMMNATTKADKQKWSWELQSLVVDKYCLFIPLNHQPGLSAKAKYVQGDHLDYNWTYADWWKDK
jgi:peptide/nickel transport system substrate-binding protein